MQKNTNITVKAVYLTAKEAQEILEKNVTNRPKKNKRIEQYTNDHLAGRWRRELPIMVTLDTNDHLQNGQHTLFALTEAEAIRLQNPEAYAEAIGIEPIKIAAIIVEGVQPEDADLLDTGVSRSHGDVLFRKHLFTNDEKFTNSDYERMSKMLGTTAKIVFLRLNMGKKLRYPAKFHHADMLALLEANPGLIESVAFVYGLDKLKDEASGKAGGIKSLLPNLAYAAAAHYLAWHSQQNDDLSGKKRSLADKFFLALATGKPTKDMDHESPVFALRTWLSRQPVKKTNDVLEAMYDAVVIAWNAVANKAKHPLSPKNPFKVNVKEWLDGYVYMGGLDVPPPVVEEPVVEEAPAEEGYDQPAEAVKPADYPDVVWNREYGAWYDEATGLWFYYTGQPWTEGEEAETTEAAAA